MIFVLISLHCQAEEYVDIYLHSPDLYMAGSLSNYGHIHALKLSFSAGLTVTHTEKKNLLYIYPSNIEH
jgi:hypothetical protein